MYWAWKLFSRLVVTHRVGEDLHKYQKVSLSCNRRVANFVWTAKLNEVTRAYQSINHLINRVVRIDPLISLGGGRSCTSWLRSSSWTRAGALWFIIPVRRGPIAIEVRSTVSASSTVNLPLLERDMLLVPSLAHLTEEATHSARYFR